MRMPLPQFSAWLPSGFQTVIRGAPASIGHLEDAVAADAEVRVADAPARSAVRARGHASRSTMR